MNRRCFRIGSMGLKVRVSVKKSRVKGDFHARFRERLGLKCPCLLDVRLEETLLKEVSKSKI